MTGTTTGIPVPESIRRALEAGNLALTRREAEEQVRRHPEDAEGWFLLGAALERSGRPAAARRAWLRATARAPSHLQIRFALTRSCLALGLKEEALTHCNEAQAIAPGDPQAFTNLGIVREALGQSEAALAAYEDALRSDPFFIDALLNRSLLLQALGRPADAKAAWMAFTARQPSHPQAWKGLADCCLTAGDLLPALDAYENLGTLSPTEDLRIAAEFRAALALALLERFEEAQAVIDRIGRRKPDALRQLRRQIYPSEYEPSNSIDARALFVLHHFEQLQQCNWDKRFRFIEVFGQMISNPPALTDRALGFRAMALGLEPMKQQALGRQIAGGFATGAQNSRPPRDRGQRPLNIGYLSPDFHLHASSLLVHRLFSLHRRERFHVRAYAIGPITTDAMRQTIARQADAFIDLSMLDDEAAAQRIAEDDIDLLIDLAGYMDYCRPGILVRRPSPLQIAWLGYQTTTGAPWIDYALTDDIAASGGTERHFTENLLRLPHSMVFCSYANHPVIPIPRAAAGLPPEAMVLAAFHSGYKIDPDVFAIWMRLLDACPQAILWLLEERPQMVEHLRNSAAKVGISPSRLVFAPKLEHSRHLARLACADLFLDTAQCNGVTTICDAVVAGVPVVTCMGDTVIQRIGASILTAAGFPTGITTSLSDYFTVAREWLKNPAGLAEHRKQMNAARSSASFFDLEAWVEAYEQLLLETWQARCRS